MALRSLKKPSPALRYGSIAAVWVVIIAVGRSVRPAESGAAQPANTENSRYAAARQHNEGAIVGTLAGKQYRVTLLATPAGARYNVADSSGAAIARMLDATALAATFPDIDMRSLNASPDSPQLMSAESSRQDDR